MNDDINDIIARMLKRRGISINEYARHCGISVQWAKQIAYGLGVQQKTVELLDKPCRICQRPFDADHDEEEGLHDRFPEADLGQGAKKTQVVSPRRR
jgi:transcriptional regulator with XRE-family HTH domain